MDALLFGESAGRIVVSCEPHHVERFERLAQQQGVPAAVIGRVGGARLTIGPWIDVPVDDVNRAWRTGLVNALEAEGRRPKAEGQIHSASGLRPPA